jgi:hypothetical protein
LVKPGSGGEVVDLEVVDFALCDHLHNVDNVGRGILGIRCWILAG